MRIFKLKRDSEEALREKIHRHMERAADLESRAYHPEQPRLQNSMLNEADHHRRVAEKLEEKLHHVNKRR